MEIKKISSGSFKGKLILYQYYEFIRPPHRHEILEMNLVYSGHGFYMIGKKRFDIKKNTLLFLFPGQEHVLLGKTSDLKMWIVLFETKILNEVRHNKFYKNLIAYNPDDYFCQNIKPRDADLLNNLLSDLNNRKNDALVFNSGIRHCLYLAWNAVKTAVNNEKTAEIGSDVSECIKIINNSEGEISLQSLSQQLNLHETIISRKFRKETGVAFVEYRNRIKLDAFVALARTQKESNLLRLCYEAGFGSYQQFSRIFKNHYGLSPRSIFR